MRKDHAHTTSCSICGEIKIATCSRDALGQEEEEEDGEFNRFSDCTYIYSTLSILYLARVELVKLSEMLEKAYIPRRSEFGGFLYTRDPRAIPLHRASTDALISH